MQAMWLALRKLSASQAICIHFNRVKTLKAQAFVIIWAIYLNLDLLPKAFDWTTIERTFLPLAPPL